MRGDVGIAPYKENCIQHDKLQFQLFYHILCATTRLLPGAICDMIINEVIP